MARQRRSRPDELWTVDQVSDYLDTPKATLYRWHHQRTGPRPFKIGRTLRYDPRDVWEWMQENRE
ncbi:helix-turn-helix domain-containing protein [Saccharopolyspora sp. 6T]|uniref:helix-turn-helix transcriptional regulator n=1 Tax=Saccharopolyspora sp. 6T TaxID=2877238 RepID=UPI001CD80E93|nr:helix-turn-helix domain-containing protein [Saccharopolyspora sp. 6T]MCA1188565.1 helix-turn-helix domain-containing protein [Saccharopolyspora sp. 6T]